MRARPLILMLVAASALAAISLVLGSLEAEPGAPRATQGLAKTVDDDAGAGLARAPAETNAREELAPPPAQLAGAIRVEGRVLDDRGAPAAGAAVWLQWLDAPATETAAWNVVRGDGTFGFDVERATFRVHAAGLACGEAARVVELDPRARTTRLDDLHLPAGGTIRGRVLDVRGRGLEGVEIECFARQGPVWETAYQGHAIAAGCRKVETDAEGRFAAPGLRACAHRVAFPAEYRNSRWNAPETEAVFPNGEELVFQQLADGTLAGRVVDEETGRPIQTFLVEEQPHTDADGRFELPIVASEAIWVSAEGYSGDVWWPQDEMEPGSRHEKIFELQPIRALEQPRLGVLTLRAVDDRNTPISGLRLRRVYGKRPVLRVLDDPIGSVTPDPRGGDVLTVSRSETGRELCIDAPGYALVRATLDRTPAQDQELLVVLERGAPVDVIVRDDLSLPALGWRLELDSARRKEREFTWRAPNSGILLPRTDSAEPFATNVVSGRIEGLPAGKYTLIAHALEERSAHFEFEVSAVEPRAYDFQFPQR